MRFLFLNIGKMIFALEFVMLDLNGMAPSRGQVTILHSNQSVNNWQWSKEIQLGCMQLNVESGKQ